MFQSRDFVAPLPVINDRSLIIPLFMYFIEHHDDILSMYISAKRNLMFDREMP